MKNLPSVKKELRRHTLDNDVLVYDPHDEQIHLLNPSAAKVLELMLSGASGEAIVAELNADTPNANGDELLELALGELAAARLFEDADAMKGSPSMQPTTRRDMVRRAAAIGAAIAVPSILTLAPNKALAQSSGLAAGDACTTSGQCLSGCCGSNNASPCLNKRCSPVTCTSCEPL